MTPYNNTPANLEILAEECAEVIRAKSKVMRFGLYDYHPKNEEVNRKALAIELGHVQAMIDILIENGTIDVEEVEEGRRNKKVKMAGWYRWSGTGE